MKGNWFRRRSVQVCWLPWLLSVNAAALVLLGGCATSREHSFNGDFNASLPTQPRYFISNEDARHFRIHVQQGTPSTGAERDIDVKEAASTIARAECQKRGWKKWRLDYIQQRNQGWMRVVITEITRE